MDKQIMFRAFRVLDGKLKVDVQIVVGGGAAMLLAHGIPLTTMDVDGLPVHTQMTLAELDSLVKNVARELKISPHWFNSYFSTFTYTIPPDYEKRLKEIYRGKRLKVSAFGVDDLLIMKSFSGREKDVGHTRALIQKGANLNFVDGYIQKLKDKGVPGAGEALDFLDEIRDQVGK